MILKYFKKNHLLLFIILLCAIFVRFLLSFLPGFKVDVNTWFAWANRLVELGFSKFYDPKVWTHYTPGYLYIFWILGILKKTFHLSSQSALLQLFKFPNNLADILTAILIYKIIARKKARWALLGLIFYLFNPALIFNSSVWGQLDSFLNLLMLVSLYFLLEGEKVFLSALFLSLSVLVKPQALFILPVFAVFLFKKYKIQKSIKFFSIFVLTTLLLSLPFFPDNPILGLPNLIIQMGNDYPYTTLEAFNMWQLFGDRQQDNLLFWGLSKYHWGLFIYLLFEIVIVSLIFLGKNKKQKYYLLAALSLFNFFLFPTRIHERYLLPVFPFLLIAASLFKSTLLISNYFLLTILHFLNLFYSYNFFYPNLIKISFLSRINYLPKFASFLTIISFLTLLGFGFKKTYYFKNEN